MTSLSESPVHDEIAMLNFPEIELEPASASRTPQTAQTCEPRAEATESSEATWHERIQEACRRAVEEERSAGEQRFRERLEIERSAITMTCAAFARERDRYFDAMEREVVQLAMAVAARILHRETAMDPGLLGAIVRHALAKLSDTDGVQMYVAADCMERWAPAARTAHLSVSEDVTLMDGAVELRCSAGVAQIGLPTQLVEIERGFFDLLARRPA